jgi:hypothetical protein
MTARAACLVSTMAVAWLALPAMARAQDAPGEATDGAAEEEGEDGFQAEFEAASTFVFRGLNVFGDAQLGQHASLFPSITVTLGAVSFGYWGAYQLSGDNARRKLDEGFSAENDLWVAYEGAAGDLGYSASLQLYAFPFADEQAAGAAVPMYLEPGVGVSYATAVELGLNVSYFRGLQAATQGLSYVYVNPTVTRELPLANDVALSLGGGFGYKLWTNDPEAVDNTFHVQLDAILTIPFGSAYVAPAVHAAVTNFEALGLADEIVVWAGIHLGGRGRSL